MMDFLVYLLACTLLLGMLLCISKLEGDSVRVRNLIEMIVACYCPIFNVVIFFITIKLFLFDGKFMKNIMNKRIF
jgi:hypothetical protein